MRKGGRGNDEGCKGEGTREGENDGYLSML